jgi:hypothetical protein
MVDTIAERGSDVKRQARVRGGRSLEKRGATRTMHALFSGEPLRMPHEGTKYAMGVDESFGASIMRDPRPAIIVVAKRGRVETKKGVDENVDTVQNVRPSRRKPTGPTARKKSQKGVDDNENHPIMCGSLGHFRVGRERGKGDEALRPIPTIFDSVRR